MLIGIILWGFVNGIADLVVEESGRPEYSIIPLLVGSIGYGVLLLMWSKQDSAERGEELSHGWTFVIVALGVFAFVPYLFKSRGFIKGIISVLYMLGFVLVAAIFYLIFMAIVIIIKDLILGIA